MSQLKWLHSKVYFSPMLWCKPNQEPPDSIRLNDMIFLLNQYLLDCFQFSFVHWNDQLESIQGKCLHFHLPDKRVLLALLVLFVQRHESPFKAKMPNNVIMFTITFLGCGGAMYANSISSHNMRSQQAEPTSHQLHMFPLLCMIYCIHCINLYCIFSLNL